MDRKGTAVQYVQTVPVRMTVDVQNVVPRRFDVADEPVVRVRGVIDLSPNPAKKALPIWFTAEVKVYSDRTAEVLEFQPAYGAIQGPEKDRLMGIYEHAFTRAMKDTKLRLIGVMK